MRQFGLLFSCLAFLAAIIVVARRAESGQADSLVRLQQSTPGVTQVGNSNVSGTSKAGQFVGGGAGITGLNASSIATGTLADARLSGNVALENAANLFTSTNQFNGFVGINRSNQISGAEVFGIQGPATGFGGMYISSTGANGQPFYGYSLPGAIAYHYLDGFDSNKWKFYFGGVRLTLTQGGMFGIGTTTPASALDVAGTVTMTGFKLSTSPNAGYILTSDASGNGVWQAPSGGVPNPLTLVGSQAGSHIIKGSNSSTSNASSGVLGESTAATGSTYGVFGTNASSSGYGVYGLHAATGGASAGVQGESNSTSAFAAGVFGKVTAGSLGINAAGVRGQATGTQPFSYGVYGEHTGSGMGVLGSSSNGPGVYGSSTSSAGVYGESGGASSYGVWANNTGGGTALYASAGSAGRAALFQVTGASNPLYAVDATSAGTGASVKSYMTGTGSAGDFQIANAASGNTALFVQTTGSGTAIIGRTQTGGTAVYGERVANGNKGWFGGINEGGWAESTAGDGFIAKSSGTAKCGIAAQINSTNGWAVYGDATQGTGTGIGVFGTSASPNGVGGYFKNTGGGVACRVEGNCKVNQLEIVGAGDVAERFEVTDAVKPGMLVSIDPDETGKLQLCRGAYSPMVAGVVSGAGKLRPGVVLDPDVNKEAHPIAMSGRVWVYCDATENAIEPGNLLTSSSTPGYAMKVLDFPRAQGATIGKAMTRLKKGERGLVMALVSLQ